MSYIAKSVTYDGYQGISMFVGRRTDTPTPVEFTYYFELDIDPLQDMTIRFQKRGRYMEGFSYLMNPKVIELGYLAISLPNSVIIPKSNRTLNLFEAHIKSDTILFGYTATDGTKKEFRFSLAGFNERYLEQFI